MFSRRVLIQYNLVPKKYHVFYFTNKQRILHFQCIFICLQQRIKEKRGASQVKIVVFIQFDSAY